MTTTPKPRLTPAARKALAAAVTQMGVYGLPRVTAHPSTLDRLEAHQLVYRDPKEGPLLTMPGYLEGGRAADPDPAGRLAVGDIVIYDGTHEQDRGTVFVVSEVTGDRYSITDVAYPASVLCRVRRVSVRATGAKVPLGYNDEIRFDDHGNIVVTPL